MAFDFEFLFHFLKNNGSVSQTLWIKFGEEKKECFVANAFRNQRIRNQKSKI